MHELLRACELKRATKGLPVLWGLDRCPKAMGEHAYPKMALSPLINKAIPKNPSTTTLTVR